MDRNDDEIGRFVREALARGIDRAEIAAALRAAGWPEAALGDALDAYADIPFPIPVPRPPREAPAPESRFRAADAFGYLVLFSTLATCAWAAGSLIFTFVDRAFPYPGEVDYGSQSDIRHAIASLVVAYPIFLAASIVMARIRRNVPARRDSPVRRWLTYGTLFVATLCLVGNLATLVYWTLSGDLTVRFLLKVATVAVLAGGLLAFYAWDLRRDERDPAGGRGVRRVVLGAATLAAVVLVAIGLLQTDSPRIAGERRIDESRLRDLQAIEGAVRAFEAREGRLPDALADAYPAGMEPDLADPGGGAPYEYRVLAPDRFELCAEFHLPTEREATRPYAGAPSWWHGAGRHCFELRVLEGGR